MLSAVSPVVSTHAGDRRKRQLADEHQWRITDFLTIRDWSVTSGSFFEDADVKTGRKIAVIGATVATNLFRERSVGAQIQIGHVPFTITGC
jgi:hypothetical protein